MRRTTEIRSPNQSTDSQSEDKNDSDEDMDRDIPEQPLFDDDVDMPLPSPSPPPEPSRADRRARVEDVEDEEAGVGNRWVEDYPRHAGSKGAREQTYFEKYKEKQMETGDAPWMPFENEEEWQLPRLNVLDKCLIIGLNSLLVPRRV